MKTYRQHNLSFGSPTLIFSEKCSPEIEVEPSCPQQDKVKLWLNAALKKEEESWLSGKTPELIDHYCFSPLAIDVIQVRGLSVVVCVRSGWGGSKVWVRYSQDPAVTCPLCQVSTIGFQMPAARCQVNTCVSLVMLMLMLMGVLVWLLPADGWLSVRAQMCH